MRLRTLQVVRPLRALAGLLQSVGRLIRLRRCTLSCCRRGHDLCSDRRQHQNRLTGAVRKLYTALRSDGRGRLDAYELSTQTASAPTSGRSLKCYAGMPWPDGCHLRPEWTLLTFAVALEIPGQCAACRINLHRQIIAKNNSYCPRKSILSN